ncbi:MAG: hypothetical protein ACTSR8_19575 [Promethearchaeota archaeon]
MILSILGKLIMDSCYLSIGQVASLLGVCTKTLRRWDAKRLFNEYTRLFTALRGIIALTLARKYASAIGLILSVFNPDNCLIITMNTVIDF